ncbi:MAG: acyltransferase [Myxococcales bacterium]|nr:acyltransferase [Myxococcales bacterium]
MWKTLQRARAVLERDRAEGLSALELAAKSGRYLAELAAAPFFLRGVDSVGQGVRTLGRPRIDNLGFMSIGAHTLLRSVNVPVELATGRDGRLEVGEACSINYGASLGALARVQLGRRCRLGPYVMIVDSEFHDAYERAKHPLPRPVVLEDDVWVGAKASVLPGVTVGRGAIIGTGAVVTHDVEPFTVVAGVPAKVVRRLDPARFVAAK